MRVQMRKIWNRTRTYINLSTVYFGLFFSRIKAIFTVVFTLLVCYLAYRLMCANQEQLQAIYSDTALVGILGTLLGAIVGGIFTLVGSICVTKHQIKAQTQIRRKNLIYTPLYDELSEIHNIILKENPYPSFIQFIKDTQTTTPHPRFVCWTQIKSDSRFLETPKSLARLLDKLEADVKAYIKVRRPAQDAVSRILTEIFTRDLEIKCFPVPISNSLFTKIMLDKPFDLFEEMIGAYGSIQGLTDELKQKTQSTFIAECKKDNTILGLQEKYAAWIQTEEDAIKLLAAMIVKVNAAYEQ